MEEKRLEKPADKEESLVRPGGVFMVQLLLEEFCPAPPVPQMAEVLSRRLGRVEPFGSREKGGSLFAAEAYTVKFKDGSGPVQLGIKDCEPFHADQIDGTRRSQMWNCRGQQEQILSACRYAVLAHDLMGGALGTQTRANMLMDYVEALLELYPSCRAVYFLNSGKLIPAEEIRSGRHTGLSRFIEFAVNVRFFNVTGTQDSVIDTLGLSLLYIEDLQYHFHGMDPNWVVGHAYSMASYILQNDRPIKNGDTIDGIRDGQIVQDLQWRCRFEDSLLRPSRLVLDVHMGRCAAGNRG